MYWTMVPRAAILAAAVLAVAASGAAPLASGESRVLWQGPVLAGAAVVWAEEAGGTGSLHLWAPRRGERVVYRSGSLALARPLAASRSLLAFERSYPSCPPERGRVCPQAEDALAGPLAGPFRTLVGARTCSLTTAANSLALDGGLAAYLELDCARGRVRVVVRDLARRRRPLVLRDAAVAGGCCRDVSIAGRYVAWSDARGGEVVVFDRVTGRVAYRARIGRGADIDAGFDLQRDGKLAVAYRRNAAAPVSPTTVAWFSPRAPRAHVLPFPGRDTRVRIADDRIALERFLTPTKSALVVTDLAGHARTLARFAPPLRLQSRFDFDGQHIAWASDRLTGTHVDCPPPGQERPCVVRESGITTIWLRAPLAGLPRPLARLPFANVVTHQQPQR
jgi:hypothetical protein